MKILLIAFLICLVCVNSYTQTVEQSKQNTYLTHDENGCLKPEAESQTYGFWRSKVTRIVSANKVIIRGGGKNYVVNLVGIDGNFNGKNIKAFLKEKVMNEEVEFMANLRKETDQNVGGVLMLLNDEDEIDEINEYLLEKGIAKYKDFDSANLVPGYMPCRLENAEKRAKKEKLGIWAK